MNVLLVTRFVFVSSVIIKGEWFTCRHVKSSPLGADPGCGSRVRIQGADPGRGILGVRITPSPFEGLPNFIKRVEGGLTCIHVNMQCFIMSTVQDTTQKLKKSLMSQGNLAPAKVLIPKFEMCMTCLRRALHNIGFQMVCSMLISRPITLT